MLNKLNWKRGFFKETYEIFSGNSLIGTFREFTWKQKALGDLNGNKFKFKPKGFFNQTTEIIDLSSNSVVGRIASGKWSTKSTIELFNGKKYFWKYDNTWNTRWSLNGTDNQQINYKCSSTKGEIEYANMDELLILTGLFIANNYSQNSTAVIMAVMIPIIVAVS